MPEPPQLAPLDVEEQRLYSEPLLDGRAPHPISKGVPGNPTDEAHFSRLYPGSRSFGNHPKFMAIASLTASVDHRCRPPVWGIADATLRPQLRAAASTADAEKIVHSDSMSPRSPGIWSKLSQRWELNTSLAEGSARRSQQTLTVRLGLPSLSGFLLGSNSPPGGDQWTAQPLSSPECPKHAAEGLTIRQQS
ncbi:hypothetical protein CRENBAI_005126 [Crenichthys baileyi]|uniref:Uncharacterized protein n=1 Tax=Crenichthys baileyi TaxID=28760 RepID=A0AAV9SD52_9TELE